jgi:hypothetical protein
MVIKVLIFLPGVLNSFPYKPRSSRFYVALKIPSFSLILLLLFAAVKNGVLITSEEYIYFSLPGSFGCWNIPISIALLLNS